MGEWALADLQRRGFRWQQHQDAVPGAKEHNLSLSASIPSGARSTATGRFSTCTTVASTS